MKRFALLLCVFLLYSCGYRFVGSYSGIGKNIKRVYVAKVKNETGEPNLASRMRSYMIRQLNLDSRVDVAHTPKKADATLRIAIVSYSVDPSSFSSNGIASMYRCTIVALFWLKGAGKVYEKGIKVEAYRDYRASDKVSATELARKVISSKVLKDLASRIDDELFVGF